MSFDFGVLPPEIVSGWMYAGAGSAPMRVAGSVWLNLAAELEAAQSAAQAVVVELTGGAWSGPTSVSMATAVAPYLDWLATTAAAAAHAGSQAMASAAAFDTAFAMTVPPPVIAANRAQLAALVASNILGQNTPAIVATEAHYLQMWAQDTLAMFGYSADAAAAGQLAPISPAPQPASATGGLQQQLTQTLTTLHDAILKLASPLMASASSPLGTAVDQFLGTPLFTNAINGAVNTAAWFVAGTIPNAVSLGHTLAAAPAAAAEAAGAGGLAAGLGPVLASSAQPLGAVGLGTTPVAAGLGQASAVGGLSVPPSWSATAPTPGAATSTGSGWTAETETAVSGAVPAAVPPVGAAGRGGLGLNGPRYGFKPTVMPKQVFV